MPYCRQFFTKVTQAQFPVLTFPAQWIKVTPLAAPDCFDIENKSFAALG